MKKNKNKKLNSLILRAFIIIAVLMMLLSVIPTQAEINEKSKSLDEKVVSDDKVVESLKERTAASSDLVESKHFEDVKEVTSAESEKIPDLLDTNADRASSTTYPQIQNIKSSQETEKSAKSPGEQGSISNDTYDQFNTAGRTLNNVTITSGGVVNLTYHPADTTTVFSEDFEDDTVGSDPGSPWTVTEDTATTNVEISGTVYHGGAKSCMLNDADANPAGDGCSMYCSNFAAVTTGTAEFWVRCNNQAAEVSFTICLRSGTTMGPQIDFMTTNIKYYNQNLIQAYTYDQWYHFKLVFDCTTDKYDIYIDDMTTAKVTGAAFHSTVDSINNIYFLTDYWDLLGVSETPLAYIDDITIYTGTSAYYESTGNITSATTTVSGNIDSAKVSWNASDTSRLETKFAYDEAGGTAGYQVYDGGGGEGRKAESFIPNDNYLLTKVVVNVEDYGTTGDTLTVEIHGDNSNKPDESPLTSKSRSNIAATWTWEEFAFSTQIQLTSGTKYWIVLNSTGAVNNGHAIYYTGTDGINDGDYAQYASGSWSVITTTDCYFRAYGNLPSFNVSVSNNNGTNWEDVSAKNNTWHTFTYAGTQLKYRVYFYGNGSGTPKLDNIQIVYNYTPAGANNPPNKPTGLGVQGFVSGQAGLIHITDHTPDLNWTFSDPDGNAQGGYNVSVWNGSVGSGILMWYKNSTGSGTAVTYGDPEDMSPLDLADGFYYNLSVKVSDTGGLWNTSDPLQFRMNTPPPSPTGGTNLSMYEIDHTPTVSWTAGGTDAEGDTITYYVYVGTSTSPTTLEWSDTATTCDLGSNVTLSNGITYYWRVKANDSYEDSTTYAPSNNGDQFGMNTPPTTTLSTPANDTWNNSATINFTWLYSDTEGSPQNAFNISIDDNPAFTSINYYNNTTSSNNYWVFSPGSLPDGTWYWQVKTNESYEWGSWCTDYYVIKIDTAKPTSNVSAISPYWQKSSLTITAGANDILSGVKNVTLYYYNSSDNSTFSGPWLFATNETPTKIGVNWSTSWAFTFPNGTQYYRFYSIARDNATNVEDFTINDTICGYDNLPPDQVILVSPANLTNTTDTKPTFTWNAPNDNGPSGINSGGGLENYRILVDNESTFSTPYVKEYYTELTTYTPTVALSEGYYYWKVHARDEAGTWGDWSGVWVIRIDATKPEISNVQDTPDPQETGGRVNITVSVKDNVSVNVVKVNITDPSGNLVGNFSMTGINLDANNNGTYYYNTTYSTLGTYTYFIWANDTADNRNTSASLGTFTFEITSANNPPNPPTLTSPYNNTWTNDSTPLFNWTFSDPDGEESRGFNVTVSENSEFTVINYYTNQSTGTNITEVEFPEEISDGTWYWRVKANDTNGAWSDWSGWRKIKIDIVAPTVNAGSDVTKNAQFNQDATVSDNSPSSGIATYSWTKDSGPGTITFGTPTTEDTTISANTDGTYVINLTVTDNAGNSAYDTITLIWDTVIPTVNAGSDATKNAQFNQEATVTDDDPSSGIATYSWTKDSGPGTITFGTPSAEDTTISANTDGTYVINLTVTDNAGNSAYDTMTLVWDTVAPTNPTSCSEGSGAANNTWQNSTSNPSFTWSGDSDGSGSGVSGYYYYWGTSETGTGASTNYTTSASYDPDAPGEGTFYLRVKTRDNASNNASWITIFVFKYDATAPTVTAVSPAAGATTNIAITTTITKTFGEAMNQSSVNASFKVYQDGSGTNLSGTYSWSGNQCIFTPSSLLPNTTYWSNVTTGAKDLAGNSLGAANNTWFTTTAGVGVTVNSPNGGEVWTGGSSKWINYTISGGTAPYTIKLYYSTAGPTGTMNFIAYDNRNAAGTFNYTWSVPTINSTNCYVNVSVNDSTTSGYDLSYGAFEIDSTAPTVSSTDPANAATGVYVSTNVIVTFSEGMNTADTETAFGLYKEGTITKVAGVFTWNSAKTQLTLDPTSNLDTSTKYYINITTGAKDDSAPGNPLASAFSASFTTAAGVTATVNSPNGNEIWKGNTTYWINYTISGGAAPYTVKLYYSTTGPTGTMNFIAYDNRNAAGTFNYTWLTPVANSTNCYVNVSVNDSTTSGYDISNSSFTIDATLPTSTIATPEDNSCFKYKPIWLNGTCYDALSGVKKVEINITYKDNNSLAQAWTNVNLSSNYTWWDYPFSPTKEANYTIRIRAVDNASNYQASISVNITYDVTPPTTNITFVGTLGTNGWYISDVVVNLTATDTLSGVQRIENSTGMPFSTYVGNFTLTADAIYYIQYKTVDNAGNAEGTNTTIIKIDKTSPPVPTLISPSNDTWVNTSSVLFDWQDSLDACSGTANYTLQVSKTSDFSYLNYTAPNLTTTVNTSLPLDDGIYYWRVIVNDNASNSNVSEVRIVKIDTKKPGSPVLIAPVNVETPDNTPKFEWSPVADTLSGTANYTIQVSTTPSFLPSNIVYEANPSTNYSTPTTTIDDGSYWWRARAVDNANNVGEWSTAAFSVASGSPTGLELRINNGANYTNSTSVALTISVDNPTLDYRMCFSNDGVSWSDNESYYATKTWDLTLYGGNNTEGKKTVYVRCKKSAEATVYAQSDSSIILDLTPPHIILQSPENDIWTNSSHIEFRWKAWDNFWLSGNYYIQIWNYDKDEIINETSLSGSITNNETSTYPYSLPDGKYWWRVRAEDKSFNWSGFTDYWLVKIDTQKPAAPSLYQPADNNITTEMSVTFRWQNLSSNDFSGIYQYELRVDTNVFYIPGQNNSTAISLSDGAYNWKVRATDIAGNVGEFSETWTVTVDRKGPKNVRFLINGDAVYTNIEHVYLSIHAENTAWMRFSNDSENWTEWESYTTMREWNLLCTENGTVERTVYLECKSWNDVKSPVTSDSIVLDKRPPFAHILNESQMINLDYFVLGWYCEYNVLRYDISTNGADWIDVGQNTTWNFTSLKECYNVFYVRAVAFNGTPGGADSLQILVDTKKPAGISLEINSNAQFTNSTTVELRLKAQEDLSENFASGLWKIYLWNGEGWEETIEINISKIFDPINTTRGWNLLGADGNKTVWLKVVDKAGNEAINWSRIFLDRVAPANLSIIMPDYINSTTVTLTLSADDPGNTTIVSGLWQMCFKEEGGNWGSWVDYSATYNYQLQSTTDGTKTIYFKVRDRAGNENTTIGQVVLDRTKPEINVIQTPANLTEDFFYFNITITISEANPCGLPLLTYRIGSRSEVSENMIMINVNTFYFNISKRWDDYKGIYINYTISYSDMADNTNTTVVHEVIDNIVDEDLSVSDIFWEPGTVTVGEVVNITVVVHNNNESDLSNVEVVFYWRYYEIYCRCIGQVFVNLSAGSTKNLSINYTFEMAVEGYLDVKIDPDNNIPEINKGNNILTKPFTVWRTPDLTLVGISFIPEKPVENETVYINAEIENRGGDFSKTFTVEFRIGMFVNGTFNGSFIEVITSEPVSSSSSSIVSYSWKAVPGEWVVYVEINSTGIIESRLDNNNFSANLTILTIGINVYVHWLDTPKSADPGGVLDYDIKIKNMGNVNETFNLSVDAPSGWETTLLYDGKKIVNVTLEKGEERQLTLRIHVPDDANEGDVNIKVTAVSQSMGTVSYTETVVVKIKPKAVFQWWIIAVIAAIVIAVLIVLAVLAKKGVIAVKRAKPRKAEKGFNYLVKDTDTKRAYEIFSNFAKELQVLCLSATTPRKIIAAYPQLEKCKFYWLTDITMTEEKTLHPERLEFEITKIIIEFIKATKGAIMVDGIEYIIQVNGLERALEFFTSIKDIISTNHGTLVVPISPAVFKKEEMGNIEKVFDRVI